MNKTELLVRYPLSNANIQVICKYGHHKPVKFDIPHISGSLDLIKEVVMEYYKDLKIRNFDFVYEEGNVERQIQNEYDFNTFISERELDGNNYILDSLKVVENDKKSFSAWDIKEVFSEILQKNYISLEKMLSLDMKTLPPLEHEFSKNELEIFVWELQKNLEAFNKAAFTNEMTSRIYINPFMTTAVRHVKISMNKPLQLSVKVVLDGTRGYGPLDYLVKLTQILILLVVAKSDDLKQGAAQAFVQAYTAIEKLFREFSKPIVLSDYSDDMKDEKQILEYIAQILQVQAKTYDDDDSEYLSKHHCSSQGRFNDK
ncbi:unnamed protein product [Rhizophagus irregularis]|uniref:Uncharacterized protein n=1 Tax=Rhizophagus irregularis TaxID=588596 RepID=A0A916E8K6_9GLOM|nr:unnamed protein product [Rhizophagus irregularis]